MNIKFISTVMALTFATSIIANAQDEKKGEEKPFFNGIVTDISGEPIKNVRAYTKNPKIYARSNRRGEFGLSNVSESDTLHLLYKRELYVIPLEGRRGMRIRLGDQVNAERDEHLVDLGYGFVKRREHTGSSTGITREELMKTGQTNLMMALKNRVPGLSVSNSGRPGETSFVTIRGINSINSSLEPLYLVDGMEVSSLDNISIYEVDYVEVIKDANIYGARGANGVISVHSRKQ